MPNRCTELINNLSARQRNFTFEEASALIEEIYNDCTIDTVDRFHNVFFYEMCPLLSVANKVGGQNTRIVFTGADARFDGMIYLGMPQKVQRVEMTAAIDGHNDALQMELLRERGHAPAFQRIDAKGTKRNREFGPNPTTMISSRDYDDGVLAPLISNTMAAKLDKSTSNPDYVGAWLGIVFDDWCCPKDIFEKKKRFDPLCRRLLHSNPSILETFPRVFFVGVSRKYIFDCNDS